MSVFIKCMEMPKNCAECERWSICKCLNDYDDYESILYAVEDGDLVKADGCPLVEIPTPHGRLIDADELKKKVLKWLPSDPCDQEEKEFPFETDICVSMLMEIEESEPIIEAEGET